MPGAHAKIMFMMATMAAAVSPVCTSSVPAPAQQHPSSSATATSGHSALPSAAQDSPSHCCLHCHSDTILLPDTERVPRKLSLKQSLGASTHLELVT